jgi:hypothetical protein
MKKQLELLILFLIIIFFATSCSFEGIKKYRNVIALKSELQKLYPDEKLYIGFVKEKKLEIVFLDSPLKNLPTYDKQLMINEFSRITSNVFRPAVIDDVSLFFVKEKRYLSAKSYKTEEYYQPGKILSDSLDVVFEEVKLFNDTGDSLDWDSVEYTDKFNKSECAYVTWELSVRRNNPDEELEFPVIHKYFTSDDELIYNEITNLILPKDWKYVDNQRGFGWEKPGYWKPGKYYVKLYCEEKCFFSTDFEIINDTHKKYIISLDAYVSYVKVYNSSGGSKKKERIYKSKFEKQEAKYLNFEIGLEHPFLNKNQSFNMHYNFYRKRDEPIYLSYSGRYHMKQHWGNSYYTGGTGWEEAGNWQTGKYFVEIFINNEKVGKAVFEIL